MSSSNPSRIGRRQFLALACASAAVAVARPADANGPECVTLEAFAVPAGDHPHDVAPAADGVRAWYTAQHAGALGVLDPLTGGVEKIDLGHGARPHGVIVAPDGAAWVTDGGRDEVQRVDAVSREITRYPIGVTGANLNTAAIDKAGRVWFTGQTGYVGVVDPGDGTVITVEALRGRGPYGICATPAGDIWFVSLAGSYLGKLRLANGRIRASQIDPPTAGAGCRRVWSDSLGRLWVAEWNAGRVAVYDPSDERWREWRLPGDAPQAYAVYVDDQDIVWLTDFGANALVRFDPAGERFDSYPFARPNAAVRQLLGRPGEVWGAESATDYLVVARTICAGP